jgi:cellulose synthase/poly-beta-1,6-N-acetylglucosamine synthase-like glycosyltransferase
LLIVLVVCAILLSVYILFLLYAARTLYRLTEPLASTQTLPVSVIVAIHNAELDVRSCLECLLNQEYPSELLEIILVADRCHDATEKIIKTYIPGNPRLKMISLKQPPDNFAPKKYAISTAISRANGEIILLTDVDGRPGRCWVKSMVGLFQENTGMIVGYAPYSTEAPYHTLLYRLLALEYFSHAAVAAVTTAWGYPLTCVGTNLAYRKRVFDKLGGFGKYKSYLSGDDDLFLQRVRDETDWEIKYACDAESQVFNKPPDSFTQFYQQRLRYASKGFLYPPGVTFALIGFFILNLILLLSPLLLIGSPQFISPVAGMIILKMTCEYHFLRQAGVYLSDSRYGKPFPLASLLHVPYVVYFGLMAQLQKYNWGGKKRAQIMDNRI